MTALAVVLAAVAAALLTTPSARPSREWIPGAASVDPVAHAAADAVASYRTARGFLSTRRVIVFVAAGATLLLVFARGSLLALGLIGLGAALAVGRLATSARARTDAERREERVLEVCEVLVGELRAGQPPVTALGRCVEVWPEFEFVATAARLGADVPEAFRRLGERRGAGGLRHVAGAWQVSRESGAGLAVALAQVATSARESASTRRLVASELASAQATARLVAGLPLVALLMGSGIGGDPWRFLLSTPVGLVCLAGGLALAFAGLTWIDKLATAVMSR